MQNLTITFHSHRGQLYREYVDTNGLGEESKQKEINSSKLSILHLLTVYSAFSLLTMRHPTTKVRKGNKIKKIILWLRSELHLFSGPL